MKKTIKNKTKWNCIVKRAGSLFLALTLALTFLPVLAFAVDEEDTGIAIGALHQKVNDSGSPAGDFSTDSTVKISPAHFTVVGDTSEDSINLWPTSSNMISAGEDDGSTVPYIVDEKGDTWYLNGIQWANNIPGLNPSATATGEILSSSEIYNAALDGSKDAYEFDPDVISGEPETIYANSLLHVDSAYYICYNWTATPPEAWGFGELPPKYTVNYDINLPSGVTQLYRIMYDEQRDEDYLEITDQGALGDVKTDVSELTRDVYEGRNFYVAAGLASRYRGFLAFSDPTNEDVSYYYLSIDAEETNYPWMTGDDTITYYKSGQTVQAASDLADDNNIITLKANWEKIDPLTEDQLEDADDALTLDVFERGGYYKGDSSALTNVEANDLLLQWTSVDENLDVYGIKTGNDVMLDEESTISYLLTTRLNSRLTSLRDDTNYGKFARFTFTLNIDNQLKFANVDADGYASIVFSSAFLKPVVDNPTNITGATVANEGNGSYRITFAPTKVPTSTDEKSMQIEIQVEWCLDKYSYAETTKPIQISGLDFKLKEPVADKENFTLNSSANITGSMDMKKRSNIRFYYTAAYGLLNGSSEWQAYFKGNGADPVALVHALQFMDYKLAGYDLSADTLATLDANTVTATVVQSELVEVTPANITVYEGGDGGYNAVVGNSGTTSSKSLPYPMFKIKTPDGIDPEDLTFTNGGKSWKVTKTEDPDLYYFEPVSGTSDPVRVTYSYTDENNEKHTVTEDAFDPATMGDVYGKLTIELYPGENDLNDVTARTADGKIYRLSVGTGTLTVRAVQDSDATSDVISSEDEGSVGSFNEDGVYTGEIQSGNAVAVAPAGTTYTLNNTGVELPEDAIPSLLFDSIIEDGNSTTRTDALKEQASEWLDDNGLATGGTRHYEAKYLDLVDANNGNAWISSSAGTDIYWGYPEGTDKNTNFTLLHFNGLHRDGENSGYYEEDIAAAKLEQVEIENLDNGIKFHVGSGGFSPFVLVWTEASAPGPDPTPDPDPEPTPDPDEPGIADPDDTGVADWLNTEDHEVFLNGYPDGNFGPDRSMTRAEVAAMFSNLLLDKNVPITTSFSDVAEDAWYADAVNMLASLDMIAGYEDGTFRPDAPITRAEFTAIAMRFADAVPEGENIFSDVHAGDWFYDVVVGSIQYGWIGGYEDGTFRPQNTITRAEVTAITNRMLGRVADEAFIDAADALRSFGDLSDAHWAYYSIMEATNAHDYTISDGVEEWEALH